MEMSTPTANKRRPVLRIPQLISSPLRKSHIGKTPVVLKRLEEKEQERRNRSSLIAVQKPLVEINFGTPSFTETTQLTGDNEIRDHLRICAKLFADNKISSKNAWELHVIDIIKRITSRDTENIFQVAGISLDIGTEVYSFRVDDIYERGLKLVNKMSGQDTNNKPNNDVSVNIVLEGDVNVMKRKHAAKKKKILHKDKKCTAEKDKSNLFAEIKVLEPPLFRTKEDIDTSAIDNFLTLKLRTDSATHQLALLSNKKYWNDEPDQILAIRSQVVDGELPKVTDFTICHHFKDFEISEWNPENEKHQFVNSSTDDIVVDDQGIPLPELDGSIHDIFKNIHDDFTIDEKEQSPEAFHAQIHEGIGRIVDAIPEEYRVATDYAFNTTIKTVTGKLVFKLWAGPSHWKVKFNKRSIAKFTGRNKKLAVKQPQKVSLPKPLEFLDVKLAEINVDYSPQVNKRGPGTSTVDKVLLPEIYPKDLQRIMVHFLLKPNTLRPQKVSAQRQNIDSEDSGIPVYDYDNPNNSQYSCQHVNDGVHKNEMSFNSFARNRPLAAQKNICEENLVEASTTELSQPLLYASHAKKIDMEKLKTALWNIILRNKAGRDIEPVTFSTLYQDLPSRLKANMKRDLTCPLAFVGLLHLCNENDLELIQENRMDFTITKAKS